MTAETTPERSEFTPTTADIRDHWACRYGEFGGDDKQDPDEEAAFDRWIKAHDAETARKAAEKGWDECHTALSYYIVRRDLNVQGLEQPSNPYRAERIAPDTAVEALPPEIFPGTRAALGALTVRAEQIGENRG